MNEEDIYKNVGKNRWPYVDEPRPQPPAAQGRAPRRRPDASCVVETDSRPKPKPLAPAGAAAIPDATPDTTTNSLGQG